MVNITEILHLLPPYLYDIEDYLALTSTDRTTRDIVRDFSTPHTLLLLCHQSRLTFFRPDPLFLLSALARPLSAWASRSTDNLRRLVHSFWSGEEAVLDLAISVPAVAIEAKWSLSTVRKLWEWRMRVVNPLSDLLDKCVGKQWYEVPDFWDGGAEDAATLEAEPYETLFRMIIYGELFGDAYAEWIEEAYVGNPSVIPPHASIPTRLEFVKYILPDWHTPPAATEGTDGIHRGLNVDCSRPYRDGEILTPPQKLVHPVTGHTRTIHPYRAVQRDVGGYVPPDKDREFQAVLLHLFTSSILWARVTSKVRELCGGDFTTPTKYVWREKEGDLRWRQGLWEDALYMLGHEGMEMVIQVWNVLKVEGGAEVEQRGPGWDRLRRYREVIAAMKVEPERVDIGQRWTYEVPYFLRDMSVTEWDR